MALPRSVLRYKDLFLKAGLVDELQMRSALAHLEQWGGRLPQILVQRGFAEEATVMQLVAEQVRMPISHLGQVAKEPSFHGGFDPQDCEDKGFFPISLKNRILQVAMADPSDLGLVDMLQSRFNARVQHVLVAESEIKVAIDRILRGHTGHDHVPGSASGIGASSAAQRTEAVFEIDHSEPPATDGGGYGSGAPMKNARAAPAAPEAPAGLSDFMKRPPSANTMLDEMFEESGAVEGGFTQADLLKLEELRANQAKTSTILRALQVILTEKGYLA